MRRPRAQESVATRRGSSPTPAFADGTADTPKAETASRVLEIDEVDASTAVPEATSGTLAVALPSVPIAAPIAAPTDTIESGAGRDRRGGLLSVGEGLPSSNPRSDGETASSHQGRRISTFTDRCSTSCGPCRRMPTAAVRAPADGDDRRTLLSLNTADRPRGAAESRRAWQLEDSLVPWRKSLGWARWLAIGCLVLFAMATQFEARCRGWYDPHWSWKGV